MTDETAESKPISVSMHGKRYTASYSVIEGFVAVSTDKGSKFLKHDVVPVEVVAELLLRDLVHEGLA